VYLGAGWGGLVKQISEEFPHAQITAYEISTWPLIILFLSTCFDKKISVLRKNFFDVDLRKFDVLVCYLSPRHMIKMEQKFLHAGSRPQKQVMISCAFPMPNTQPIEVVELSNFLVKTKIYVYITGL
jgi:hypothetical protein